MGKSPGQAALDGTQEVAMPMFVATLTFAIVFFPVVFLSGLAKFLFTPLAVAASIAIFASYVLAITLVPAYCARFLSVRDDPTHEESTGLLAAAYAYRTAVIHRCELTLSATVHRDPTPRPSQLADP